MYNVYVTVGIDGGYGHIKLTFPHLTQVKILTYIPKIPFIDHLTLFRKVGFLF